MIAAQQLAGHVADDGARQHRRRLASASARRTWFRGEDRGHRRGGHRERRQPLRVDAPQGARGRAGWSRSPADQEVALELLSVVMQADGTQRNPVEQDLHDELVAYFRAAPTLAPVAGPPPTEQLVLEPPLQLARAQGIRPSAPPVARASLRDGSRAAPRASSAIILLRGDHHVGTPARAPAGRLLGVTEVQGSSRPARVARWSCSRPPTRSLDGADRPR